MNKTFSTLVIICLMVGICYAQDPTLSWVKSIGGVGNQYGTSVTIDNLGNVYSTGYYDGQQDFDPSAAIFNLTSNGSIDGYVQKLDNAGNFIWAQTIGGTLIDIGTKITTDASGDVYVTGRFEDTVDFDPGAGVLNLTANGLYDVYIQKLDPNGNLIWAISIGGANYQYVNGITIDASKNVYLSGYYRDTADFDPGAATYNLSSNGLQDFYVLKLDSLGNFVWAKSFGGPSGDVVRSMAQDASGNVYLIGWFKDSVDFNPGGTPFTIISNGDFDVFILKLDPSGNFVWAKSIGGPTIDAARSITIDATGDVCVIGQFTNTVDFDPNIGTFNMTSNGADDVYILKLDSLGNFIWAKSFGGTGNDYGEGVVTDSPGNIYLTGYYYYTVDFDPGGGALNYTSNGSWDIYIQKLDANGNFKWATSMGGASGDYGMSIALDASQNVFVTGRYQDSVDFDPGVNTFNLVAAGMDIFVLKLQQKGAKGLVFNDISIDCVVDNNETGLVGRRLVINPGDIVVQTDSRGYWHIDSLPIGTYTVTADTSGPWQRTCAISQNFTVVDPNIVTMSPSFGFVSTAPCASPNVSIVAPLLRPCFSNQRVYVQACNDNMASGVLGSAFVEIQLDPLLTVQSASLSYTALGGNAYRFDLGTIYPGMCSNFNISCMLNCSAILGQTLCMQADLYPSDSCTYDSSPDTVATGVSPCTVPWDNSSLRVEVSCVNDSIRFVVYNTGDAGAGNMDCYSAVRVYIDGQFIALDSVLLAGGDSAIFVFSGDGRTWRLEADQHPLHPGNSHPNATIELCGDTSNWTPGLVNVLPLNDDDPITDIYCGVVTGSFDPNDKTGFPLGVSDSNYIAPNQDLQYLIRFQNTGTDTAFTVVIRDTLAADFDIFSVVSGVSSHIYSFRMYGPRVLEWTFNYILLPDSNVNEPESHGFVTFKVAQDNNLSNGTALLNDADIYFDFNAPVITNETSHIIDDGYRLPQLAGQSTMTYSGCSSYSLNGFTYSNSGTYMQNLVSTGGLDSLVTLNLTIGAPSSASINPIGCTSYTVPSGDETHVVAGTYMDTIPNSVGCDSIITLNLIFISIDTGVTILTEDNWFANATSGTFQWIECAKDSIIAGQTSAGFQPSADGSYAVIITDNGCSDTSTCIPVQVVGIGELSLDGGVNLYPNPVTNELTFEFESSEERLITIYNSMGKKISIYESKGSENVIDIKNLGNGAYFYKIQMLKGGVLIGRGSFVKE